MRQTKAKKIKRAVERSIDPNLENRDKVVKSTYRKVKKTYAKMTKRQKLSFDKSLV